MIDIRLNTFLTLAKIKSYTMAAEILNITQPAVSQQIKHLEEYYGTKLFKRNGKNIELTDEGNILLKYVEEIEILYRLADAEIKNRSGIVKTYNLGASMTIGGYVLPNILAKYKKINKNATILLQVHNTEEIIEKLVTRKLDFAVIEGPFDRSRFKYRKFKDDELVLAVSPENKIADKKRADISEVLKGSLILREKGSGTRKVFEDRLIESGYSMESTEGFMEIGSISAIKSLVESNLGYTVISKEAIRKEMSLGTIKVVPVKNFSITREFNFIWLPESDEDFINRFIDFCIEN